MKALSLVLLLAVGAGALGGCTRKLVPSEQSPSTAFADPDRDPATGTQSCDRFCAGYCGTCGGPCTCELRQKAAQSRGFSGMGGKECIGVCRGGSRDGSTQPK